MLSLFALLLLATYASAQTAEEQRVNTILGSTYLPGLVLNADFSTQPTGTTNWQWLQEDVRDTDATIRSQHQGLAKFTGATTSYIDLNQPSGANSCGRTLGMFGGQGFGHGSTINRPGVSIEMVVKFDAVTNWAKPFDFNTGPGIDELTWTWDGDSDGLGRFLIEQYVNASLVNINFDKGAMEFFRPNLGEWYHLTHIMVPSTAGVGAGTWYIFIDGRKIALSNALEAGTSHTALQSANYPLRIPRPYQYIARSGWAADPYMQMTLDALRVYDFALTDDHISQLATSYGLNNDRYVPLQPAATDPFPVSAERSKYRLPGVIEFDPVYSLDFATNPTQVVGSPLNYQWLSTDTTDTPEEQAKHTGLAKFNGGPNEFLDLMVATGPNSAGKVVPTLFTNSQGTGTAFGWTIEMVVKPLAIQTWSKYFCLGTGPYYDAIYTGWLGGDNLWEAASYNNIRDDLRPFSPGQLTFYRAPTLNKWTHLTWVITPSAPGPHPLSSYAATWSLYVGGQLVTQSNVSTNYPLPVVRRQAYIARSVWAADTPARMVMDSFRVWDRALNADQVEAISDAYGISPLDGGDAAWTTALGNRRAPVYNLDFQTNPTQNVGQPPVSWQWREQDPSDSTVVQGLHTGLAIFDGTANSWIDLTQSTGPNRVPDSLTMPAVGGPTNPGGGLASGWSFEMVFKAVGTARGWSKMFVISNGADRDEIVLGFDADGANLIVQNYIEDAVSPYAYAASEVVKPTVLGKWYHIVVTMRPGSVEGSGNWVIYVNGQAQLWSDRLVPGTTYSEVQGASFPRAVARPNSYLARSTWSDPTSILVVDAFRIYDYVIDQTMVTAFAQAYGTYEIIPVPTPANNVALPSSAEQTNWQVANLPRPPIFNGVFSDNPASYVGGRTDYAWLAVDPSDNAAQQGLHRGLLVFNGTDAAYADLNLVTGPKSVGQIMPIIGGAGSGSGETRGMTIELVVKLTAVETWAKLIQMSSGPDLDSLVIGWNNDRYNTIEVHNFNRARPGLQRVGAVDLFAQPPLNQWLFITLVMQLTDENTLTGNWIAYESGSVIARHSSTATNNPANFPLPTYRTYNYMAKSSWNDPTATMLVDMYRVYDYALTETQVRDSVSQYGMYGTSRPVAPPTNVTLPWPETDESRGAAAAVRGKPAPVFNAWFPTNPITQVVSPLGLSYPWVEFDPADSPADRALHRGLIQLNGDPECYIDVNTNSGPNSCGVVAPIIGGRGSGSGETMGWSFELVFKVTTMTSWVKLFNFGNGPELNNIILGVDGTDSSTMAFEVFDREQTAWPHGFAEVFQPELNRWYHVVLTIAPTLNTTSGAGVWYFYVNGNKLAYSDAILPGTSFTPIQGASYPKAVFRRNSYIGKSNWNDPTFRGLLDAFRIYDYRLNPTEVGNLAAVYGLRDNSVTLPTPADNKNVNTPDVAEVNAWNHDGISAPVFNANFGRDPRTVIGGLPASFDYNWMERDPADNSADQSRHTGLIYLNGNTSSYIDLAHASGSQSVGLVLPTLFTAGSGSGNERGWTVELVTKLHREELWSKLVNFATGGNDWMDSFGITWNGNDDVSQRNQWSIQNYNNLNPVAGQPNELGFANFLQPVVLNKWYHIAVVMQPHGPSDRFKALWKVYVDGTLVYANADQNMPLPVIRENSYIGASQWGNQDRKCMMTVDALRIYDKALTVAQIQSLARQYGHTPTPSPVQEPPLEPVLPPLDPNSGGGGVTPPGPGTSDSSSSSSLSGGAIAGIVIGCIVGAAVLCVILFCVCAGGNRYGRGGKSSSSDPDAMKGNVGYGQMEHSQQTGASEDEIEMGETETGA